MPIQCRYIKNKHEAECRVPYIKYTRDHVNHLVDVRDILKDSVYFLVEASNGQGQSIQL